MSQSPRGVPIGLTCSARETTTHCEHRSWDGTSWTGWVTIGSGIVDTPSAVSWGVNRIDVLALGTEGQLLHKHFSATESS